MTCTAASLIPTLQSSTYSATRLVFFFTCAMAISSQCFAQGDAVRGENLYRESCKACHSLDQNGIAPKHRGVFGRQAGSVPNYDYSEALKKSGIMWNAEALDKWLVDPQAFVPDNKMFFSTEDAQERSDIIAFLKEKAK